MKQKNFNQKNNYSLNLRGFGESEATNFIENMQYSKYHTKSGHGFAAEDANAFNDKIRFRKIEMTGKNNELNGADRIVDGIKIQTKYCKTPQETINSAFDKTTGIFRYKNQVLEVPADQYDECVKLMEKKIAEGKVPGITDPKEAKNIVKKGAVTYKQACNIARAGNIDSILFDVKTQSVVATHTLGLSFVISFAHAKWKGLSNEEAIKAGLKTAIETAGVSFISGIITAQLLRTKSAAAMTITMRDGVKVAYKTSAGKSAIESLAKASLNKPVYGAAAVNHVSKLLRSNAIISAVSIAIITAPDFYRAAIKKNISWKQFTKNLVVNVATVTGGVGGWMTGVSIGAAIGSIFPGPGTAIGAFLGGLAGAVTGGTVSGKISKTVVDAFAKDDAVEMIEILEETISEIAFDYSLLEEEIKELVDSLKKKVNIDFLKRMYQAGQGDFYKSKKFAYNEIENIVRTIISKRKKIYLPPEKEIINVIDKIA